ncbi:MAG: hypothetical protein ACRD10_09940, partial [Terriglobia bacterium]
SGPASISLAPFVTITADVRDPVAEREFESIRELVVAVRNAKAEQNLQRERPSAQIASEDARLLDLLREHQEVILRLAGLAALNFVPGRLTAAIPVNAALDLRILHESKPDAAAERNRLEREKSKIEQALAQARDQLENQDFIQRAPSGVVRSVEQRRRDLSAQYERLVESLGRLRGA